MAAVMAQTRLIVTTVSINHLARIMTAAVILMVLEMTVQQRLTLAATAAAATVAISRTVNVIQMTVAMDMIMRMMVEEGKARISSLVPPVAMLIMAEGCLRHLPHGVHRSTSLLQLTIINAFLLRSKASLTTNKRGNMSV